MTDDLASISAELEAAFRAGNGAAALRMIRAANALRQPIPLWCFKALNFIMVAAETGEISSWDEVLGKPFPKGTQPRGLKTRARSFEIWRAVKERHEAGEPIDDKLFESVAKKLKIGTAGSSSTVKAIYSKIEGKVRQFEIEGDERRLQ